MNLCRHCKVKPARRTAHCSDECRRADENRKYQNYQIQRKKALTRKLHLIDQQGGGCVRCGYKANIAALQFHHKDPASKLFTLDQNNLANRRISALHEEADKCTLLCSNCHAEVHNPQLDVTNYPALLE